MTQFSAPSHNGVQYEEYQICKTSGTGANNLRNDLLMGIAILLTFRSWENPNQDCIM